jgi:hypothetical protein
MAHECIFEKDGNENKYNNSIFGNCDWSWKTRIGSGIDCFSSYTFVCITFCVGSIDCCYFDEEKDGSKDDIDEEYVVEPRSATENVSKENDVTGVPLTAIAPSSSDAINPLSCTTPPVGQVVLSRRPTFTSTERQGLNSTSNARPPFSSKIRHNIANKWYIIGIAIVIYLVIVIADIYIRLLPFLRVNHQKCFELTSIHCIIDLIMFI